KFYFYIKNGELVLEKGILKLSKTNIPIDRIQTVNFQQNILHQLFNVVQLEIDTAGSAGTEISINALSRKKAEALRRYVEQNKPTPASVEQPTHKKTPDTFQVLVLALRPADLLKIGVSQNHLRTAGILMAFFYSFLDDIEQALHLDFFKRIDKWVETTGEGWMLYLLAGIPVFIFISFLITLARTTLEFYNFRLWRTPRGFKTERGLFTKTEQFAHLKKIQILRWQVNPVMRLFKMCSVRFYQAASVVVRRRNALFVPGCYQNQLRQIRQIYWPESTILPFESHRVSKLICRRQILYFGVLPAIVLVAIRFAAHGFSALGWLFWIPIVYYLSLQYHKNLRYQLSDDGLITVSGLFTHQYSALQWYKIQTVEIRQSIYQRRKGVSTLVLYTAAGSVKIPYIELEKAHAIRDFALFKIEIDRRQWM
ncbi:MAG: hypothetical protein D6714_11250, partial [Bacteroidetes bacterium]